MKYKFIKLILLLTLAFVVFLFIYGTLTIGNKNSGKLLKSIFDTETKTTVKKYLFPYKYISQLEDQINEQDKILLTMRNFTSLAELDFKKKNIDINTIKTEIKLSDNKKLSKYTFTNGFYSGIKYPFIGTGYLDFFKNNLVVVSSKGILAYKNLNDLNNSLNFKQIPNNIDNFINSENFVKGRGVSIKDLLIHEKKIYISYTDEIKEDCWNNSILVGEFNMSFISFVKLFSPEDCIHSIDNIDKEFRHEQSGGRIVAFDEDHILYSLGEYRSRYLAQDKNSINGKIIKININNSKYEIIAMGFRNPQGLFYDEQNKFIFETEHGPRHGDEINIINIPKKEGENEIPNYGWPISSYGEHYGGREDPNNSEKYLKYPLYKSHIDYGFIEPFKIFTPGIGISQILKIEKNKYVLGSMTDRHLYFFELGENYTMKNLKKIEIFERIRDLAIKNKNLYLFLEDTPSMAILNIENL